MLLILESIPRQGSRSVSDIRRQADFDVLCITCRLSLGRRTNPSPFPSGFGQIPGKLSLYRAQLLNNAPPVPSAFIGAPVSPRVPPRGRELVPTLDRDYCDGARHLLTCRASRMALASDFCPGEIPKSLGLLTRRLPDLTTRTLQVLAMACPISTSHPPCPLEHGCFRRLSYSPTSRACAPECRDSKISPESLIPSRVIRTPSVVALVRPFRAAPGWDSHPLSSAVRVIPVARRPVSVSPNLGLGSLGLGRIRGGEPRKRPLQPDEPHYGHPATGNAARDRWQRAREGRLSEFGMRWRTSLPSGKSGGSMRMWRHPGLDAFSWGPVEYRHRMRRFRFFPRNRACSAWNLL